MSDTITLVLAAGGGAALLVLAASALLMGEAAQRDLSRRVRRVAVGETASTLEPVRAARHSLFSAIRRIGETLLATSLFSARDIKRPFHHESVRFIAADGWAAKAPSGFERHVRAQSQAVRIRDGVVQHLHPLGTKKIDVIRVATFYAIDGNDLHSAEAAFLKRL